MQTRLSLILVVSMLTACGGGSSGGDSSAGTTAGATTTGATDTGTTDSGDTGGSTGGDTVSQIGFIDIDQFLFDTSAPDIELSAGFISSSTTINLDALSNEIKPTNDICQVRENVPFLDDGDDDIDFTNINPSNITTISAGETVTFTSPAGTYATLDRETAFGFTGYSLELDSNTSVPSGLTVDIPGDEFPAFSNVPVPPVAFLTGLTISTGDVIDASSTFTWDASADSGSRLSISAYTDFDFANLLTSTRTEVDCEVVDDGSFSFPAAIQSQMGSITATDIEISRINISFVQSGNALLVVSSYTN